MPDNNMTVYPEKSSVLIIAGETSGDMHGASLMNAMKALNSNLVFFGIGGDRMITEGLEPVQHVRDMAILGFFEVVRHLWFLYRVYRDLIRLLRTRNPSLVILIDYPGFNLRFAKQSKKMGYRNLYYISPQVWAWKKSRVNQIAKSIDRMLVILPFETEIYRKKGMDVHFVGHPLKGNLASNQSKSQFCKENTLNPSSPIIGLLPGSRKQEISRLLPEMSRACKIVQTHLPDAQFIIGMAPHFSENDYLPYLNQAPVRFIRQDTYGVMAHADAVWVASGTATLETALLGTPMVICYKMAVLSYVLGRLLVHIRFIGLVNIVAGKMISTELIQNRANGRAMARAILPMITDPIYRNRIKNELERVSDHLGKPGASQRAAALALEMIAGDKL
jgi:lipid-A-disaccharide synthase